MASLAKQYNQYGIYTCVYMHVCVFLWIYTFKHSVIYICIILLRSAKLKNKTVNYFSCKMGLFNVAENCTLGHASYGKKTLASPEKEEKDNSFIKDRVGKGSCKQKSLGVS